MESGGATGGLSPLHQVQEIVVHGEKRRIDGWRTDGDAANKRK